MPDAQHPHPVAGDVYLCGSDTCWRHRPWFKPNCCHHSPRHCLCTVKGKWGGLGTNGTRPATGRKNPDVKLGWEGKNAKSQFRNKNTIQHLPKKKKKSHYQPRGRMGRLQSSFPGEQGNVHSTCQSVLGIPLWLKHKGHQHYTSFGYGSLFCSLSSSNQSAPMYTHRNWVAIL